MGKRLRERARWELFRFSGDPALALGFVPIPVRLGSINADPNTGFHVDSQEDEQGWLFMWRDSDGVWIVDSIGREGEAETEDWS